MFSAPDTARLALLGLLAAATLLSGCTRSKTTRPFSDVTDADRGESTLAEPAPADVTADATDTAPPSDAQPQPVEMAATDTTQQPQEPPPPQRTVPPAEEPAIVPPTETIRAETPTAAGPATTAVTNGAARYHIVAQSPAIVEFRSPLGGPESAEIPVQIDERGLVRQWPLWVSERPSGNTVAGPTYWTQISREPKRSELSQGFIEPAEFLWNTLLLPYRVVVTPPWTKVTYDPATEEDQPHPPYDAYTVPPQQEEQRQDPGAQQQ